MRQARERRQNAMGSHKTCARQNYEKLQPCGSVRTVIGASWSSTMLLCRDDGAVTCDANRQKTERSHWTTYRISIRCSSLGFALLG